jgi:hypothetical protein
MLFAFVGMALYEPLDDPVMDVIGETQLPE